MDEGAKGLFMLGQVSEHSPKVTSCCHLKLLVLCLVIKIKFIEWTGIKGFTTLQINDGQEQLIHGDCRDQGIHAGVPNPEHANQWSEASVRVIVSMQASGIRMSPCQI